VISIAKGDDEFRTLRAALANQTFRDFEFVCSTKNSIPEAWNDAISRARGEFLVFTESDAVPLNNRWLEEIANRAREGCVMKGLEVRPSGLNLCNLLCDARIFKSVKFDESFLIHEDTELFAHLRELGTAPEFVNAFPVIHSQSQSWKKSVKRGLRGMYYMKIIYQHGRKNMDDINTQNQSSNHVHPISNRLRVIVENLLTLMGLLVGAVLYFPISLKQRRRQERRQSASTGN
jgi:GT2 family glycosyltransferase